MRTLAGLSIVVLINSVGFAEEPPPSKIRGADSSAQRGTNLRSPGTGGDVDVGGHKEREPQVGAAANQHRAPEVNDDVRMELVHKQMRRNVPSIEKCKAAARKQSPGVTGKLVLNLSIDDHKVVDSKVTDDTVGNPRLEKCL